MTRPEEAAYSSDHPRALRAAGAHALITAGLSAADSLKSAAALLSRTEKDAVGVATRNLAVTERALNAAQTTLSAVAQATGDARLAKAAEVVGVVLDATRTAQQILAVGRTALTDLLTRGAGIPRPNVGAREDLATALKVAYTLASRSENPQLRGAAPILRTLTSLTTQHAARPSKLPDAEAFLLNVTLAFLAQQAGSGAASRATGARRQLGVDLRWYGLAQQAAQKLGVPS
ncbi:beta/alpha barrel domain-containing protein [Deinococcus sp. PEB2-67]